MGKLSVPERPTSTTSIGGGEGFTDVLRRAGLTTDSPASSNIGEIDKSPSFVPKRCKYAADSPKYSELNTPEMCAVGTPVDYSRPQSNCESEGGGGNDDDTTQQLIKKSLDMANRSGDSME